MKRYRLGLIAQQAHYRRELSLDSLSTPYPTWVLYSSKHQLRPICDKKANKDFGKGSAESASLQKSEHDWLICGKQL
jgi:hypothetical protein